MIFNQQIHELDYIQWIFGKPISVFSVNGRNGSLDIDVEDYVSSIFRINGANGQSFPVYAHGDFFQYPPVRRCKVIGENGRIEADLLTNRMLVCRRNERREESFDNFTRNDMFIQELEDFMSAIKRGEPPEISLEEAMVSMRMAVASLISGKEKRIVNLEEIEW